MDEAESEGEARCKRKGRWCLLEDVTMDLSDAGGRRYLRLLHECFIYTDLSPSARHTAGTFIQIYYGHERYNVQW
jgi:hypothetical protein